MASAPYEHVESPCIIDIDGVRAFNPGNAVPIETAKRIGLLDEYPDLEVVPARKEQGSRVTFRDVPIVVEEADATPGNTPEAPAPSKPPKAASTSEQPSTSPGKSTS